MADGSKFEFGEILRETLRLKDDLRKAVLGSEDTKIAALMKDLEGIRLVGATHDAPPLSIAFIGQYDAGKSTILRVLTGRQDIVIDSDVSTDAVTAYDWNGVRLLDTPGIHAGYRDHDDKTYTAIDRADLLVFVITNELFDDTMGRHFRELAFARQHAREMLLVVNKMGQDPGTPETKRPDIEKVTSPLLAADFRTVFIDARSWLEAQAEKDAQDRNDLLEIANIPVLIAALNTFISDRGLAGRLSTPLFTIRGLAEQGHALLSTDIPEERAALELLHRKRGILLASRSRLRVAMSGILARAVSDISKYGDEVAENIEPGKTEQDVERLHADAQRKARDRSEALALEAQACVEGELSELRKQLEALRDGVLARELREQVGGAAPSGASELISEFATPSWNARSREPLLKEWPDKAKKIGDIANNIGGWAAKWATGPMSESATIGSASAARGSQAHQVIYNVGKFFGVNFRPWGAIKVARAIGNAGRVISAVGGVLAVVAQIAEDRQQQQYRIQLRDARDGVRSAYRDSALSVQSAFSDRFESFLKDFYESELNAIGELVEDLTGKRSQRSTGADAFAELARRAATLIDRTHVTSEKGETGLAVA
ncbi:MAG TPA: GTPase [Myxococcaceae bacterium]|jgi:hypothetical protein